MNSAPSCRLLYKPRVLQSVGSTSSLSQDSYIFKDGLSDISSDSHNMHKDPPPELLYPSPPPSSITTTTLLLTPDDFTASPSHQTAAPGSNAEHLPVVSTEAVPQRRKSSQHSGASSPSREVAEILAPNKELLHLDEMEQENVTPSKDAEIESVSNNLGSFSANSGTSRNSQDYNLKEWPQAPDPTKDYRLASRTENDMQSLTQHFQRTSGDVAEPSFQNDLNIQVPAFSQNLDSMGHKLDSIVQFLRAQHQEIQALQNEIKVLRQDHKTNQQPAQKDQSVSNLGAAHNAECGAAPYPFAGFV
ncbi:hypothetical protein JTE90_025168 [Oedothorax gibbosus]|uniref:Uncharacterized protein n=1 Tax=Oedothorax gibbosus TaxID=931172 RepID=A0AAV6UHP3_9ARAC|nr:hypothetical protein JTE90_025168 [Oedothorax gibbosus]